MANHQTCFQKKGIEETHEECEENHSTAKAFPNVHWQMLFELDGLS